jgi:RNA polymerase sigma factor (sigma-70 family)
MILWYTNERLVQGLLQGKKSSIDYIYREYFPMVRSVVGTRHGSVADAEDVFHDGLIIMYDRLHTPGFTLKSSFKTYLFAVCRNLWRRRLERKYRLMYGVGASVEEPSFDYAQIGSSEEEEAEKYRLYRKHLLEMPEFCQKLLQLYLQKTPSEKIARIMNYKDVEYVKARKYHCKNLLRKKILNDPQCKQFMNYE